MCPSYLPSICTEKFLPQRSLRERGIFSQLLSRHKFPGAKQNTPSLFICFFLADLWRTNTLNCFDRRPRRSVRRARSSRRKFAPTRPRTENGSSLVESLTFPAVTNSSLIRPLTAEQDMARSTKPSKIHGHRYSHVMYTYIYNVVLGLSSPTRQSPAEEPLKFAFVPDLASLCGLFWVCLVLSVSIHSLAHFSYSRCYSTRARRASMTICFSFQRYFENDD